MANLITTDTELTSVASAIRAKTGGTAQLEYPAEFISEIGGLMPAADSAENQTFGNPGAGAPDPDTVMTVTVGQLDDIADAILAKTGESEPLEYPTEFISEIGTLTNTSDADATAGDIASGKTAYVNGVKITGTIADATGVEF